MTDASTSFVKVRTEVHNSSKTYSRLNLRNSEVYTFFQSRIGRQRTKRRKRNFRQIPEMNAFDDQLL